MNQEVRLYYCHQLLSQHGTETDSNLFQNGKKQTHNDQAKLNKRKLYSVQLFGLVQAQWSWETKNTETVIAEEKGDNYICLR